MLPHAGGAAHGRGFSTWLAALAPKGVVDDLATSGEYLREKMRDADVVLVTPAQDRPRSLIEQLSGAALGLLPARPLGSSPHERFAAV